jgi:hypothetical protein
MSPCCATADTLVLPFSLGLLIGGELTGCIILSLGWERFLVNLMGGYLFLTWTCFVLLSTFVGSLLAIAVLALLSCCAPFPLAVRDPFAGLVVLGIVAGSASTLLSCLTMDLAPHPELHHYKGPESWFPIYILTVSAIAPLLLVKRGTTEVVKSAANTGQPQSPPSADQPPADGLA